MNCERARELFSGYLEGGTDRGFAADLRGHLGQCESCSREFELFKQTWHLLGTLPEVEPPSNFRHDVIMRAACTQHEELQSARRSVFAVNWDLLLTRLVPARAVAIACAGAVLAVILLRVPPSAYEHFAGMFNPRVDIESVESNRPANAIEASPLSMESELKHEWQSRKLGRNTVWVTVSPKDNGNGATVYRVMLSINKAALLPDETTQRIGARVYLLPGNKFTVEDVKAAVPEWDGSILADSPVLVPVMPVIVAQSQGRVASVNLLVTWRFRHRDFAYIIFIPTQRMPSSRDVFDFSMGGAGFARGGSDLYSTLQTIAQDYGVPVIASAYLNRHLPVIRFGTEALDETLMQTLKPVGLDWLFADQAVYVDREYDVE